MTPVCPRFGGFYEVTLKHPNGKAMADPRPYYDAFRESEPGKELVDRIASLVGGFRGGLYEGYNVYWSGQHVVIAANDAHGDDYTRMNEELESDARIFNREWPENERVEYLVRDAIDEAGYSRLHVTVDQYAENPFTRFDLLAHRNPGRSQ